MSSSVLSLCDELLQLLHDSAQGFETCSQDTQDQSLKESFQLISQSRATICQQLQQMVKQTLGSSLELSTPPSSSSLSAAVTGLLYRRWIDLKSLITGGKDNKTILNEVSRGESYLTDKYKEIIQQDTLVPEELRTVLQQQLQQIQLQDVGYAKYA
ncbi:unnamed protein product [Didymodactylos carnosus]|uniref:DUF2383 domain-containing protein n=1 Tax=Didymodactylos carnosus TaxID=1234261 RepID=A0A8S2YEZ4_9BILA|nr:unnamed protein product [Didymodactylos carnosus]